MTAALKARSTMTGPEVAEMRALRAVSRRHVVAGSIAMAAALAGARHAGAQATPASTPTGTKRITTVAGEVEIPLEPKRLMVMENTSDLEIAVALGLDVESVGVYSGFGDAGGKWVMPWVPFDAASATRFETAANDIELVLALNPDLIISRAYYLDPEYGYGYDQLSQAAPVIPVGTGELDWKAELLQMGDWLERTEAAEAAIAEYDALIEEIRERHADAISSKRIAVIRLMSAEQFFINVDTTTVFVSVLTDLGGQLDDFTAEGTRQVSTERANDFAGADAILFWGWQEDFDLAATIPTWTSLPAVQAGRIIEANGLLLGSSVYSAIETARIYDRLFELLA